jgi:hypothetical protein
LPIEMGPAAPAAISGVCRLIANHPHLIIVKSTPEVRVLPSTGITRPQQYYDPVRLPLRAVAPSAPLRLLPSPGTGLPRLPASPFQRAVPTTPADRAGALVDFFPAHAAFPVIQAGRHPHHHFRGLLRLHTLRPAGLLNRPRRPLSRGFGPTGCPAKPLVSYQTYRQLSGWNLPPLALRAVGAH